MRCCHRWVWHRCRKFFHPSHRSTQRLLTTQQTTLLTQACNQHWMELGKSFSLRHKLQNRQLTEVSSIVALKERNHHLCQLFKYKLPTFSQRRTSSTRSKLKQQTPERNTSEMVRKLLHTFHLFLSAFNRHRNKFNSLFEHQTNRHNQNLLRTV